MTATARLGGGARPQPFRLGDGNIYRGMVVDELQARREDGVRGRLRCHSDGTLHFYVGVNLPALLGLDCERGEDVTYEDAKAMARQAPSDPEAGVTRADVDAFRRYMDECRAAVEAAA